jgi:L-fuconolactonase
MISRSNRRAFLQTVAAGLTAGAGVGCRALSQAGDTAAARLIIDTHTHFYDPFRPQGVPWPPADDPVLYRTVMPSQYRSLPKPATVAGTVVVEASPWVEDNQWVLDLAAREPFIVGFVGNLSAGTPAFAGHLSRFAAHPRFVGIRLRGVDLSAALQDPAFMADLGRVSDRRRSVDLVGGPELLAPARHLATALPGLRIVIDHLAGVRIDGGPPPADWLSGMSTLAKHPNVSCKVSGLVEGSGQRGGQAPRALEFYRPILDAMWERFGPDRLIYGSNWPVCEHFATLATVQAIASDYFEQKGPAAWAKVFAQNASVAYQCAPVPGAHAARAQR